MSFRAPGADEILSRRLHIPCAAKGISTTHKRRQSRVACSSIQEAKAVALETSLKDLNVYLSDGDGENEAAALQLMEDLKEKGQIVGYDGGRRIPKRSYSLAELRMHQIDAAKLLAPKDTTLSRLKTSVGFAYLAGITAGVLGDALSIMGAATLTLTVGLLIGVDQVRTGGGVEFLMIEYLATLFVPSYRKRVALHEAGHFLVAYLSGLLPKNYTLSAMDYFKKYRLFNIQAGTTFCDSEFQQEIKEGQLKASSLDRVTCVAVAGVCAEYLNYGHAEGGLNDILQLDFLMRSLKFSQKKVDSELRWAVLNTVSLLRRHRKVHWQVADYMSEDRTVAECIQLIEEHLRQTADI